MITKTCSVEGCETRGMALGLCHIHYERVRRTGSPHLKIRVPKICSVDGCETKQKGQGYCSKHLARFEKHGHTDKVSSARPCSVEGCDKPRSSGGMCSKHAHRFKKHGDPLVARASVTAKQRLANNTIQVGDCLGWVGSRHPQGYGKTAHKGKKTSTHRLAYEAAYGPIPKDMHVLHKCDNPPCCNPEHLFLGTQLDNMRDMITKGRGRKPKGESHPHAKLTEAEVLKIRTDLAGGATQPELAKEYGVGTNTIQKINVRKTWAHI